MLASSYREVAPMPGRCCGCTDAAVHADADAKKLVSRLTASQEQNGTVPHMRIAAIDA